MRRTYYTKRFIKGDFHVYILPDLDFGDIDDDLTGLDIGTLGATRVIRKGASAVKETAAGIVSNINE